MNGNGYYVEEPTPLIDFGAHVAYAFTGAGDDNSSRSSSDGVFAMGGMIGLHLGVDISDFVLLGLINAGAHVQAAGGAARGYAGGGPAALVGWRPTLDRNARASIEAGAGFDYGVSTVLDSSIPDPARVEGVFPTVHLRLLITARDADGLPVNVGFHVMAAIPPQDPSLFLVAAGIVLGLRSL